MVGWVERGKTRHVGARHLIRVQLGHGEPAGHGWRAGYGVSGRARRCGGEGHGCRAGQGTEFGEGHGGKDMVGRAWHACRDRARHELQGTAIRRGRARREVGAGQGTAGGRSRVDTRFNARLLREARQGRCARQGKANTRGKAGQMR
jgi:hypothetical protein